MKQKKWQLFLEIYLLLIRILAVAMKCFTDFTISSLPSIWTNTNIGSITVVAIGVILAPSFSTFVPICVH